MENEKDVSRYSCTVDSRSSKSSEDSEICATDNGKIHLAVRLIAVTLAILNNSISLTPLALLRLVLKKKYYGKNRS